MTSAPVDAAARRGVPVSVGIGAGVLVLVGVALRMTSRSDLWLDEALSVNIAHLPLGEMFDALRRDGHPPLYYLLLHAWTGAFGTGDEAARSLSGVLSVATLPLLWFAGRRYGGPATGLVALVLLATNPFAIRYGTEARMYALVTLLVVAGWLALRTSLERSSNGALAGVGVVAGLLLLTHYWSFYLVAAVALVLMWLWRRGHPRARAALLALVVGCLLFVPWLPAFLSQAGHTGTPWGEPERPTTVITVSLTDWGGGTLNGLNGEAQLLGALLAVLALLALFARPADDDHLELDVRTFPHVRAEAVVVALTIAIAVAASYATASAFASRYTAGVFPLVLLVAAYGVTRLPRPAIQVGATVVVAALGVVGGIDNLLTQRTQAGVVASYVRANGSKGDVVAFCPDQLGPAVDRLLSDGFHEVTFPEGAPPELVDWVDYEERLDDSDPAAFASMLDERAGAGTVWLVWAGEYRTLGTRCETLSDELRRLRPGGTPVVSSGEEFEHAWLFQYGARP